MERLLKIKEDGKREFAIDFDFAMYMREKCKTRIKYLESTGAFFKREQIAELNAMHNFWVDLCMNLCPQHEIAHCIGKMSYCKICKTTEIYIKRVVDNFDLVYSKNCLNCANEIKEQCSMAKQNGVNDEIQLQAIFDFNMHTDIPCVSWKGNSKKE